MKWTEEETERLKALAPTHTYKQLCEMFGRNPDAIRAKLRSFGIKNLNASHRSEDQYYELLKQFRELGLKGFMEKNGFTKDQATGIVYRAKAREKKIAQGVRVSRAESLRLGAIGHACSNGLQSHAEDFASYCVMRLYEGRSTHRIRYMFVDYKRETFGDTRNDLGKIQNASSYMPIEIGDSEEDIYRVDPEEKKQNLPVFELLRELPIKGPLRACFVLHAVHGLTMKEIALCFNVTESRISQILTEAEALIKKSYKTKSSETT